MKYLRLIQKNALRNKRRTLLTMFSIAVSVFLVATLRSVLTELNRGAETSNALLMVTRSNVSLINNLPISYWERLRNVIGVESVTPMQWFGGIYKDQQYSFANFSVDPVSWRNVTGDTIQLPKEQEAAWFKNRVGCIIGRVLAEKYGWTLGDRVPLYSDIFNIEADFVIEGIFTGRDEDSLYFHWKYLSEPSSPGTSAQDAVGTFFFRLKSANQMSQVAQTIDEMFHNSSAETLTESERSFMLSFVSMWGNITQFIFIIASAVVFTILLITGNAMAISIRERRGEVAIMKAIGFKGSTILGMFLGEATLICLTGGILGTFGAGVFGKSLEKIQTGTTMIPSLHITGSTIIICLFLAVLVGLISTAVPAFHASRLTVAEALRRVG